MSVLSIRSALLGDLGASVRGLAFTPTRDTLWRVTTASGGMLGYIELVDGEGGRRFVARRWLGGSRSREVGRFWSAQDAADCFA